MTDEKKPVSSADNEGSTDDLIKKDLSPNPNGDGGEPGSGENKSGKDAFNPEDFVPKTQYAEAEKKLGEQGRELGDYRKFVNDISPLLDKLNDLPELAELIIEGKIDSKLVNAIAEGKVNLSDAAEVAKAHETVKKEMGKKEYDDASKEDIEKLIAEKVAEMRKDMEATASKVERQLSESEERRAFEQSVNEFIKNTPDFADYADDIAQWFEDNPKQYDVQIAYDAVKGRKLAVRNKEEEEARAAEAAKELASNAAGGGSQGAQMVSDEDAVDKLIGRSSNPNLL